jgi:hypothetical protein
MITAILTAGSFTSCDYLDVVPDNIATLDHAFANRLEAERFLFTCYSYIPGTSNVGANIGLCGADEIWTNRYKENDGLRVAQGLQNINDPFLNYWEGRRGASVNMYNGIRDCNIFLEALEDASKIHDLSPSMRKRWICEVKFLKAYYHFYLFRMYGPIVIADKNIPISATTEEVRVKRMPVDSVVNYIANLYDESMGDVTIPDLPLKIANEVEELGRITQAVVLSMKARLLVTAASPLFNGNPDYYDFVNKDNTPLFPQKEDPHKWEIARDACEAALAACEEAGIKPFVFTERDGLPDEMQLQMTIRNSFADDRWSSELIWGLTGSGRRGNDNLQARAMARLNPEREAALNNAAASDELNPTIQITNFYYTKNGVPINEDKTWLNGKGKTDIVTVGAEYQNLLVEGYDIAALHFDREPRFYANLAFDGAIWYMQNSTTTTMWTVKSRIGQQQARLGADWFSVTGYWPKKLVNWYYVINSSYGSRTVRDYPWPEMRLSDLYLLYAETLCETGNMEGAIEYVDKIREKAGLLGVVESWQNYSNRLDKYTTYEGLKEIIKQERTIELMFEGSRYWDIRRWKDLPNLNQTIQGWDVDQETAMAYYRFKTIYNQNFVVPRDYFSPIREEALIINPNLVQNVGW